MHLGIITKTYTRPSLSETLDAVVSQGIRHVQLNLLSASLPTIPAALTAAQCEEIRRALDGRRIIHAALSATFNIIHPDPRVRAAAFDGFAVLARSARSLGTRVLTISTGTRDPEDMWRKHPDNSRQDTWRDMLASMSRIAAVAEQYDVTAALEPEQANVIDSAPKARALLDTLGSNHVKILIDAANLLNLTNLARQKFVLEEAFDQLGSDTVLAHAKEYSADGQLGNLALGRGVVDFRLYVSLLRSTSEEIPLIMHGFPEHDVAESIAYLTQLTR
ncbi:MAG TPA: sugar phosphate isomerase/epimerase [Bryobacteraceae bacterium]|nr:sugar phosphate isomerase/epimerase [Bryobacteraceae bacterium]